jgi:hypothetical protein
MAFTVAGPHRTGAHRTHGDANAVSCGPSGAEIRHNNTLKNVASQLVPFKSENDIDSNVITGQYARCLDIPVVPASAAQNRRSARSRLKTAWGDRSLSVMT